MIKLRIAGLNVEIDNRFRFLEEQTRSYRCDFERADVSVRVTDEDILYERTIAEGSFSDAYIESIAAYRKIADAISAFSAAVFHGAVIALSGKAYLVTARSGVGKTTHLSLWLRRYGDEVHILNGDKPILRDIDGVVYACGTPWQGKEDLGVNEMLPLGGVAFLERAEKNSAERISPERSVIPLVSQMYIPAEEGARRALLLANKIVLGVPMYRLRANMEPEAAEVARAAFESL